jgi:hypothetical protein
MTSPSDPRPSTPRSAATPEGPFGRDTSPEAEAILVEGYRRMTPAQKMERVAALTRMVQELALSDIRRRHPHANERELHLRLASRWLDRETMVKAFGWDPAVQGY